MEQLIGSICSRLADHYLLIGLAGNPFLHDFYKHLDAYAQLIFAAIPKRSVGFHSETSSGVDAQSLTLLQDASFIHSYIDHHLALITPKLSTRRFPICLVNAVLFLRLELICLVISVCSSSKYCFLSIFADPFQSSR